MSRGRRRLFGSIRKTSAGRWQARYKGPDGRTHNGPHTFAEKADAGRYLNAMEAEIHRGSWSDRKAERTTLRAHAADFMATRTLAPRTRELYERHLRIFVLPYLGDYTLNRITPTVVTTWHVQVGNETTPTVQGQTYRLLRAVMGEALRRQLIDANPCTIRGAGSVRSPERPYLEPRSVWAIIENAPDDQRAAWILTYGAHLRLGELLALRRSDLSLTTASPTVRVERQAIEIGGEIMVTPTKTKERRTIDLPASVAEVMREHIASMPPSLPTALLFTRTGGSRLRHRQVQKAWRAAREAVGLPDVHFHDLRHAGLTLAAITGVSQRELMQRGGHSTPHAAMIYQHVAEGRGADIAMAMDALLLAARRTS